MTSPLAPLPLREGGWGEGARALNRAKAMRREPTPAERQLWLTLRARRFSGFKFRRQQPIGRYIVDFVCLSHRLIVEAAGGQHSESNYDQQRDAWFQWQGFRVMRFGNADILSNAEGVCDAILTALQTPLPNLSPARGEGLIGVRS